MGGNPSADLSVEANTEGKQRAGHLRRGGRRQPAAEDDGEIKMIEMMMMMSTLFVVGMAKKKAEPRWIQMTLTGGSEKGAVDWLKPNTKIKPSTIRFGTANNFRIDGFHIPDFVKDDTQCIILIDRDDTVRRPLLVHQKTAMIAALVWMKSTAYSMDSVNNDIETIHTDEPWELNFRRGKGKFDPYTLSAQDLSDGPGGAV